jgi:molecular chaperone GrpE (heat shock protein)
MDTRLEIKDAPRELAPGVTAETPLTAIMWRALRAEHQRRAKERQQSDAESKRTGHSLAKVAEEVHRLRRTLDSIKTTLGEAGKENEAQQLQSIRSNIEAALAELQIVIIAPEGEPYTGDLMELLDNIAQQPAPELASPHVAEVLKPAITYRGALLRMGKAIIAIPDGKSAAATETTEPVAPQEDVTQEAAKESSPLADDLLAKFIGIE